MTFPNDREPMPVRLLRAVPSGALRSGASNVVPLRRRKVGRWGWPQWTAIGASLIVGVSVGRLALLREVYQSPIATTDGGMLVDGALARALSHQLVSDQTAADPVWIGVSFRAKSGEYCRTFTLYQSALAGVACRAARGWQLRVLARAESPAADSGADQRAPAAMPAAVLAAVADQIAGRPLDARAELAARGRHWRP